MVSVRPPSLLPVIGLTEVMSRNKQKNMNPFVTNPYQLVESTFSFCGIRNDLSSLFHFSMKFLYANRIAPDGKPLN